MAGSTKKKAPKQRRWTLPKLFMLLGIVGLCGILVAIFVMQQELNRIGFFNKGKRLPPQIPPPLQKEAPNVPPMTPPAPSQAAPPSTVVSPAPGETSRPTLAPPGKPALSSVPNEGLSAEDRKRLEGLTSSQSPEKLSQDDRKSLEDILRKHPK